MKGVALIVAALALALTWVPFAPAEEASREVACGSVVDYYRGEHRSRQYVLASRITGLDVRCGAARKIARGFISRSHFARVTRSGDRRILNRWPKGVGRFSCSNERVGSDVRTIACQDGAEAVTFGWYDSSPYH